MVFARASLVLRQAEERTKLVVDCAGLVRRLEELDAEIAEYDQWQRFEEARRREAEEAKGRGQGDQFPLSSLHGTLPFAPTGPPTSPPPHRMRLQSAFGGPAPEEDEDGERRFAVAHLQRALRAADFEAEVWRQRAHDAAEASDHERAQARLLMEFELSIALREADEERLRSTLLLRDRDAAFEKVDAEVRVMQAEQETQAERLRDARRREAEQATRCERLADVLASKEAALASLRRENEVAASDGAAHRSLAISLEQELYKLRGDRDVVAQALEDQRAELRRRSKNAAAREAALDSEVTSVRRALAAASAEASASRVLVERFEAELQSTRAEREAFRAERAAKAEAAEAAQMRAELLSAKCDNLEAALENSTRRQAEMAMDKMRETNVPQVLASTVSTMAGSLASSPRIISPPASPNALPPMRQPSDSRTPVKVRRDMLAMH